MKGGASGWLTVLPLREDGYDLSATQFRDQLNIRYHRAPFCLQHGLDCPKGGLVKKSHNDLCDCDAKLADVVRGGVSVEPMLVPENDRQTRLMLQADWRVRGVWEGSCVAFFDDCIVDADTSSYIQANLSWEAIVNGAASTKKSKYHSAAEELRASFTRLVCSTEGVLHREYAAYQRRLACRLASKWQKPAILCHHGVGLRPHTVCNLPLC